LDCQLNTIDARDIASGLRVAMKVGRPRIRYLLGGVLVQTWKTRLAAVTPGVEEPTSAQVARERRGQSTWEIRQNDITKFMGD
jgi:hypothetical protein